MGESIGEEVRVAARDHQTLCDLCEHRVLKGQSFVRWLWKDGRDVGGVKVHEACYDAWDWSEDDGEFTRGSLQRDPCPCGRSERAK